MSELSPPHPLLNPLLHFYLALKRRPSPLLEPVADP